MGKAKFLTFEQIMAAPDLAEEVVEVPEWGGAVKIKALTKSLQQRLRQDATLRANTQTQKQGDIDSSRLEMLLLVHGVVEPKLELAHIPQLREKAAGPIEHILKALLRLNGMTEEAVEKAEATFPEES